MTEAPESRAGPRRRGRRVALIWNTNTVAFSYPQAKDAEAFKTAVQALPRRGHAGRRLHHPLGDRAGDADVMQRHHERVADGRTRASRCTHRPRSARESYTSACAGSGYTDWLVWAVDRAMEDYDIDGIYVDNTGPYYCDNDQHGCGGPTDALPVSSTPATCTSACGRSSTAASPRTGLIWEHNSRTSNSFNLTFVDIYSDGEHFRVKSKGRPEEITPHVAGHHRHRAAVGLAGRASWPRRSTGASSTPTGCWPACCPSATCCAGSRRTWTSRGCSPVLRGPPSTSAWTSEPVEWYTPEAARMAADHARGAAGGGLSCEPTAGCW